MWEAAISSRRRARDDIDWVRAGIGAAIGLGLAPGLAIGSYYLALLTGEDAWIHAGFLPMPVLMLVAIWLVGRDIWSRLIILLLALMPAAYLFFVLYWNFACPLPSINCSF